MAVDHYSTLELDRSATVDEIRESYLRLVRANHPDRNPGNPEAIVRFKKIQQAYEVLSKRHALTRHNLFLTPFEAQLDVRPAPPPNKKTNASSAFSPQEAQRRHDAIRRGRVWRWFAGASTATALVASIWGLSHSVRVNTTIRPVAPDLIAHGRLEQEYNVARHIPATSDFPSSKLSSSDLDYGFFANTPIEFPFDPQGKTLLFALQDTPLTDFGGTSLLEGVRRMSLGLNIEPPTAEDPWAAWDSIATSDGTTPLVGASTGIDSEGLVDDPAAEAPDLLRSSSSVTLTGGFEQTEGLFRAPTDKELAVHRQKIDRLLGAPDRWSPPATDWVNSEQTSISPAAAWPPARPLAAAPMPQPFPLPLGGETRRKEDRVNNKLGVASLNPSHDFSSPVNQAQASGVWQFLPSSQGRSRPASLSRVSTPFPHDDEIDRFKGRSRAGAMSPKPPPTSPTETPPSTRAGGHSPPSFPSVLGAADRRFDHHESEWNNGLGDAGWVGSRQDKIRRFSHEPSVSYQSPVPGQAAPRRPAREIVGRSFGAGLDYHQIDRHIYQPSLPDTSYRTPYGANPKERRPEFAHRVVGKRGRVSRPKTSSTPNMTWNSGASWEFNVREQGRPTPR